ncbi:hypothetical protein AT746_07630 [Lacimicrobium alkaliphilum]|uniref:Uncharacterized protein n=1 Tax=Lacimicrobium alkaliphilum TaxID=1526571 RepID=A0A0U3AAU9_9ALTE|nr:hypothetical protein AT746_07630 [Lacimicrobium alkaliphilum]
MHRNPDVPFLKLKLTINILWNWILRKEKQDRLGVCHRILRSKKVEFAIQNKNVHTSRVCLFRTFLARHKSTIFILATILYV